jgi:uncharacterized Zn-binding protein involved in type VI secretion
MPAAKRGDPIVPTDQIVAEDMHMIQPPGLTAVLTPHPFKGIIDGGLSANVNIMGQPAAMQGSTATNTPPHLPIGGTFVKPPSNQATIISGSATVMINGKPAARAGDTAITCNDPEDLPIGKVEAVGTVNIG